MDKNVLEFEKPIFELEKKIEEMKQLEDNLDIKNPNTVEDELGDPDELLAEYKTLLKEVAETREALKRELRGALGGDDE